MNQYKKILTNFRTSNLIWHMDEDFVFYNPLFFIESNHNFYLLKRYIKPNCLIGNTMITDTRLYFSYYLEKMEAIRREIILGEMDLARLTYDQILAQKLDSICYYDYLKGFVFKFLNEEHQIEEGYIPANSLNQLLDRISFFKETAVQDLVPFRFDNSEYVKTLIKINNIGEIPDDLPSTIRLLESKLNKI